MSSEEFNVLNIDKDSRSGLKEMHLSDQALGAVMMALQKSLLEQSDIIPTLKEFIFLAEDLDQGELVVSNPPIVSFDNELFKNIEEAKAD